MDEILSTVNAEPAANVEPQNNEAVNNEPTQANIAEPAEPQQGNEPQQKQAQSPEENAIYAKIRREAEQKAYAKAQDELIARMYGETHGIHTVAEYEAAIAKQQEEERLNELLNEGISEKFATELIENRKFREQFEAEQKAKQQQEQQQAEYQDFIKRYPNVKPEEIPAEVWKVNASGVPLRYAYADYAQELAEKAEAKAKANAENAKGSMGSISGAGSTEPEFISRDTFEAKKGDRSWVIRNLSKINSSRAKW